jgi:hypothetical protein
MLVSQAHTINQYKNFTADGDTVVKVAGSIPDCVIGIFH